MVMPDKTVVCKSIESPLIDGIEIGGLLNIIRPSEDGGCIIPVKIAGLSDKGEIIAVIPAGKPQKIQRRVFERVRADNNVQLKLQFDRYNSRYKSSRVYDISGGGVGVTIYSKNPIDLGQQVKVEIELFNSRSRIIVTGRVTHCTLRNPSTREYLLGLKFTEICERDQQRIIDYVNEEQRRQDQDQKDKLAREQREKGTKKDTEKTAS